MLMINGIFGGKCAVGKVGIMYGLVNCPVLIKDIAMAPSSLYAEGTRCLEGNWVKWLTGIVRDNSSIFLLYPVTVVIHRAL